MNCNIAIAAAKGFCKKPSLWKKHGSIIEKWAESFLTRRGFVKRKGTNAARKLPADYPDNKLDYLKRIQDEVETHKSTSNLSPLFRVSPSYQLSKYIASIISPLACKSIAPMF